jgi:integrase
MARTAKINRLTAVAVKRYFENTESTAPLHDGGGLYLRKREASALWYLRLSDPATGAEQWHRLFPDDPAGGYPHKTLAEAREEASRRWSIRSEGRDPRAERVREINEKRAADEAAEAEARRRLTVQQLFDRWAEVELAPHQRADGKRAGRKDGGEYIRQQFERRLFPVLGTTAAKDVRKADLLAILDEAKASGRLRTANVLLASLKQMFRFALAREIVERNPLETVTKRDAGGSEVERERVLAEAEITALARALPGANMSKRSQAAIWIILATGCRVGELMNAEWRYVDLVARTWHLPDTKNGRDHTIHLSEFALKRFEVLDALKEVDAEGKPLPWVLPNSSGDGAVCIKSFGKQLSDRQRAPERRMKGRSKNTESLLLPGGRWTAHDLRRTAATMIAAAGISGDVIDECLNHVIESRVRRTYIRDRRPTEQARAFDVLGTRLASLLLDGSRTSKVVKLRTSPRAVATA